VTASTSTQPERIQGDGGYTYDDTYQCDPLNYDSAQVGGIT
jgi:hypothetical protein